MRTREVYIEDSKSLPGTSGVETINLNVIDPISVLLIGFNAMNAAAATVELPPSSKINSIEIVDGSEVIYSLNGHQAIANAAFDMGKFPSVSYSECSSNPQSVIIPIFFGRYLGDPELALDPRKFRNLQLKFDWNIGTDYVSASGRLTVVPRLLPATVTPMGFLMTKEIKSWTTAENGDEPTGLPTDHNIRRIMVRSYESGISVAEALTKIKLSIDKDKEIIFNMSAEELAELCFETYGAFELCKQDFVGDGDTRNKWVDSCHLATDSRYGSLVCGGRGVIATVNSWYRNIYKVELEDAAGAHATDEIVYALCRGELPESTYCYNFGRKDVIADWLDVAGIGSLELIATQGNANGKASVFVQQLKKY